MTSLLRSKLPGPFIRKLLLSGIHHTGPHCLQVCLISTDTIQINLGCQITHEQEGLNDSKTFSSSRCTFPRTLEETRVYLRIHNSDITKLVKYLFLTAGSFWDNWADTSANTAPPLKQRGEAQDWRAIYLSGPIIIAFSRFSVSVRGGVFHDLQVSW